MGVGEVRLDGDGLVVRLDGPVRQAPGLQRQTQVPMRPGMSAWRATTFPRRSPASSFSPFRRAMTPSG